MQWKQSNKKSNKLADPESTGEVIDNIYLSQKRSEGNRNTRQILIPFLLGDFTIPLLLSSLHSQDMAFINSSASILGTIQILEYHLIFSSCTMIPATEESCSGPWWPKLLVEDPYQIQVFLALLLTLTIMFK